MKPKFITGNYLVSKKAPNGKYLERVEFFLKVTSFDEENDVYHLTFSCGNEGFLSRTAVEACYELNPKREQPKQ